MTAVAVDVAVMGVVTCFPCAVAVAGSGPGSGPGAGAVAPTWGSFAAGTTMEDPDWISPFPRLATADAVAVF